ncbi:hypothetical protein ACFQ0T_15010 [Kitasatospora gansuensis]
MKLFENDDLALAELAAGRADADLNDFPVAAYVAQQRDGGKTFQIAGAQLQPGPYGIALTKESTALREVLLKALNRVIRSGEYDKILAKWNVTGVRCRTRSPTAGSDRVRPCGLHTYTRSDRDAELVRIADSLTPRYPILI